MLPVQQEDPAIQAMAAQAYADQFSVSLQTAYARVRLQDATAPLLDRITTAIGADYAGAWYDAADGGRLKVGVAGPQDSSSLDAARAIVAAHSLLDAVDFVPVRFSMAQLLDSQQIVDRKLGAELSTGDLTTSVDVARNAVAIDATSDLTAAGDAAARSAAADAETRVIMRETGRPALKTQRLSCGFLSDVLYCDPPLRGGVEINATNGVNCTAGFLVFGNTGGSPFILTAGHCLTSSNGALWQSRFPDGTWHNVGYQHSKLDSPAGDFGLIGIENPSGWSATCCSRLWVAGVPNQTTQDSFYSITSAGYAAAGTIVCNSSGPLLRNGYHSSCGTLQSGSYTDSGVSGLSEVVGACGQPGSSGGPFFKNHVAYGTLVSGTVSGSCVTFYQPAPNAMSASNVYVS